MIGWRLLLLLVGLVTVQMYRADICLHMPRIVKMYVIVVLFKLGCHYCVGFTFLLLRWLIMESHLRWCTLCILILFVLFIIHCLFFAPFWLDVYGYILGFLFNSFTSCTSDGFQGFIHSRACCNLIINFLACLSFVYIFWYNFILI